MKKSFPTRPTGVILACLLAFLLIGTVSASAELSPLADDDFLSSEPTERVGPYDPLEPVNRVLFQFNDSVYFLLLKPAAQGYAYVVPDEIRICVREFFKNLLAPARIVNNVLQGKLHGGSVELARFFINSTIGIVGLSDPAKEGYGLMPHDEDLGQTLGHYGLGGGVYLFLPVFGPSNLRDTVGVLGDSFLSPLTHLTNAETTIGVTIQVGQQINDTSLVLGNYEAFKDSALDPYIAMRDAYHQYRIKKIGDAQVGAGSNYPFSATGKGGYSQPSPAGLAW